MCSGDDHNCPEFELHRKKLLDDLDHERRSFLKSAFVAGGGAAAWAASGTLATPASAQTRSGQPTYHYLPANADVRAGDVLVTSGLGGVFPSGYPVAKVTEVHKDAVQPAAHVRAVPFAHLDTDSEVMVIWFRHDTPAAPLKERNGELTTGDRNIQPLPAAKPVTPKAPT